MGGFRSFNYYTCISFDFSSKFSKLLISGLYFIVHHLIFRQQKELTSIYRCIRFFLISVGQSGAMWSLIPQGWSSSVLTISHLLWVWRMVIIFEYTRWIKVKMEAQWKFNRHLKMISSRYDVGNFMTFPIWNWWLHFQHHVHAAGLLWDFEPLIWKKM